MLMFVNGGAVNIFNYSKKKYWGQINFQFDFCTPNCKYHGGKTIYSHVISRPQLITWIFNGTTMRFLSIEGYTWKSDQEKNYLAIEKDTYALC